MKIIKTQDLSSQIPEMDSDVLLWVYNAHDVMIPHEILVEVDSRMNARHRAIYGFERALQGPAWSMMQNGVRVDMGLLAQELKRARIERQDLESYVRSLVITIWNDGINVRSPDQMKKFFYYDPQGFQFKPKHTGSGQKRRVTTDRKALEALASEHYYSRPIINAMLTLKDSQKEIEFLERGVEEDGRIHCSFNVAATETGRWSSSSNPWGRGANFQNQGEHTRSIYLADDSWIFAYPDLRQAESRAVAYYSGDSNYIRAVESGDLHTQVAKLIWPTLSWPDDKGAGDKALAEENFYRHFSRYDISKRGGHACNYFGSPWTLATNLNLEESVAKAFHESYHSNFPGIFKYHQEVQRQLQDKGIMITALGRERMFFGRLDDRETLKEAIAYMSQSLISDILKIGILRIWEEFELKQKKIKLFGDMHDGILMGIKEKDLDEVSPQIINLMEMKIQMPHGVMKIPVDFSVGYRWQKKEMVPWQPGVISKLHRPTPIENILDIPAELI